MKWGKEAYMTAEQENTQEQELRRRIGTIGGPDSEAVKAAQERQTALAKPPGSLGRLEAYSVQMAGITGQLRNRIEKTCVIVMSADNGIFQEGVAVTPQSVTAAQTMNFVRRTTGVGALAKIFGSDLLITDVGILDEIPRIFYTDSPFSAADRVADKIVDRKIRRGTNNFALGPAMSRAEAVAALFVGMEMADAVKQCGYDAVGIGEMGIANTTTSAAVLCGLTGCRAAAVTGRGAGLSDAGFLRKQQVIDDACGRYGWQAVPAEEDSEARSMGRALRQTPDVIDILSKVGGFELAAMVGAFLGAAVNRLPAVIDGYISVTAAAAAAAMAPKAKSFMFASHKSFERGYAYAAELLGLAPMFDLQMRLGEGSGCPLGFQVLKAACGVLSDMATFDEAAINDDYLEQVRRGGFF